MYKSFVVSIDPDEYQRSFFAKQFGCCRKVFNHYLSEKKLFYEECGEYLSYNECAHRLTGLKKELTYLKEVDSTALIQSLRNLETAFDRFFKNISGYPKFKSKNHTVQSYKTMNVNNSIRINGNKIRLPKVGWIRFHTKQVIRGTITSVTVKRKASHKYYISILCKDVPSVKFHENNRSCGVDLGISNFVTINTGEIIAFPQQNKINYLNKRIRRYQRKLSRKIKYSNNYKKLKIKISSSHEKIHNILDYHIP